MKGGNNAVNFVLKFYKVVAIIMTWLVSASVSHNFCNSYRLQETYCLCVIAQICTLQYIHCFIGQLWW